MSYSFAQNAHSVYKDMSNKKWNNLSFSVNRNYILQEKYTKTRNRIQKEIPWKSVDFQTINFWSEKPVITK